MISNRKCYYCNAELEVIKEGYTISDFCVNTEKKCVAESVEVLKTYLCRCSLCNKEEVIREEEPVFVSIDEIYKAFKEDRIFSNNPEINVLIKILQRLTI